jgi:hypothetical protein
VLSQDLVTAAQKEKQRRAQLKKRSTIVVTNDDLGKTNSERTARTSSRQENSRNTQRTTPQRPRNATSTQPASPQKRMPTQQVENVDQIDIRVDSMEQLDQLDARGFSSDYASRVMYSNELVRNPSSALDKPDGIFADIPLLGILDLQISLKNGPGDDIAIYALHSGAQSVAPGGEEEGGLPIIVADFYEEGLWYGVLGMGDQGDWVAIGKGSGTMSPEKFDLGDLSSVNKIRIMFKHFSNAEFPVQFDRTQGNENSFRIDAVEALHK